MGEAMIFNSPLEVALRVLVILDVLSPSKCDLQMLIYYDYFSLYPADSPLHKDRIMHTHTPYRGTEIAVRRQIMQESILLLIRKGLIEKCYDSSGINYKTTNTAHLFLEYFDSEYYKKYRENAEQTVEGLKHYSNTSLEHYVKNNITNWGIEFTSESMFREDYIE